MTNFNFFFEFKLKKIFLKHFLKIKSEQNMSSSVIREKLKWNELDLSKTQVIFFYLYVF